MNNTLLLGMSFCFTIVANAQMNGLNDVMAETPAQAQLSTHFFETSVVDPPVMEINLEEHFNNKPLYKSGLKKGKLNGNWQSWYQNGMPCDSGTLANGLPHGVWKHWGSDGNLLAVRTYNADKYQRIQHEIIRYHPRRATFRLVTLYKQNEALAKRFLHASYSFVKTPWKSADHSITQLVKTNIAAGSGYRPVFDHSLHHGLYKNYFANGLVRDSGYYKDGLKEGLWLHRTGQGMISKGLYSHGVKVKDWKTYDETGKLRQIEFYTPAGKLKGKKMLK